MILGGWFLAYKLLKPVDKITKTARDITAQNLDQRILSVDVDDEIGRLISTFNDMIGRLQKAWAIRQNNSLSTLPMNSERR